MKRIFDFLISFLLFVIFLGPLIIIAICVRLTSKGPALHWSRRIGQYNKIFYMPKFRTMLIETPQVATHLLQNSQSYLTPIGRFLRKTSLDELPQAWSVMVGDMSLVGPRPALFNQDDLVSLRTSKGIEKLKPGITGWAQVNGRDDLPIPTKVDFDYQYLQNNSLIFDIKILFLTAIKVLKTDGIQH
ncbi:MAG: sugar transferase [Bdellovibrionaceae bacterium]|nr:sugar transferase [Bdellovibrio sp.]